MNAVTAAGSRCVGGCRRRAGRRVRCRCRRAGRGADTDAAESDRNDKCGCTSQHRDRCFGLSLHRVFLSRLGLRCVLRLAITRTSATIAATSFFPGSSLCDGIHFGGTVFGVPDIGDAHEYPRPDTVVREFADDRWY